MSDSDDPVLEIRVTGDWSEFDRQAKQREQTAASAGVRVDPGALTFASEGRSAFGRTAGALPGIDTSRAQAAAERLGIAMERQAQQMERSAQTPRLGGWSGFEGRNKPLYMMNQTELDSQLSFERHQDATVLDRVFGSQASEYRQAERQQSSSNFETADRAFARVQQMQGALTPGQRNDLFGIGQSFHPIEQIQDFRRALGALDTESGPDLGRSLASAMSNIGSGSDPKRMTHTEQLAFAQMRAANAAIDSHGFDRNEVIQSAVLAAASRYSDPEDAAMMLERHLGGGSPAVVQTLGTAQVFGGLARQESALSRNSAPRSSPGERSIISQRFEGQLAPRQFENPGDGGSNAIVRQRAIVASGRPTYEGEVDWNYNQNPGYDDIFEGSATSRVPPHTGSTVNIPGGGGGGAGGGGGGMGAGGLPGPGGPYGGGQWAGPGFVGSYGLNQAMPPQGPQFGPPRPTFANRAYNLGARLQGRIPGISTGMYYTTLFGLWEVSSAARAAHQSQILSATADSPLGSLEALNQGVERMSSGIIGGTVALGKNLIGGLTGGETPDKLFDMFQMEKFRMAGMDRTQAGLRQQESQRAGYAARRSDMFSYQGNAAAKQSLIDTETSERDKLLLERSALHDNLSAVTRYTVLSDPSILWKNPDDVWYEDRPTLDIGARTAAEQRIKAIDKQIKEGGARTFRESQILDEQRVRAIGAANDAFELSAAGSDAEAQDFSDRTRNISGGERAILTAKRRVAVQKKADDIEQARIEVEAPETLAGFKANRTAAEGASQAEIAALEAEYERDQAAERSFTEGTVRSSGLRRDRKFDTAARQDLYTQYSAAWDAADNDKRPGLTERYLAQSQELRASQDFDAETQRMTISGASRSLSLLLQNKPYESGVNDIRMQRELALRAIPNDREDLREPTEEFYENQEKLYNKSYFFRRGLARMGGREDLEQATLRADRKPMQANADAITANATMQAIALSITDPEQSKLTLQTGIQNLRGLKNQYLDSFKGVEVESLSRVDLSGGRTGRGENLDEVIKKIDEGSKELAGLLQQGVDKLDHLVAGP